MRFAAAWEDARRAVDARFEALLAQEDPALRAALGPSLAGGKRLRPTLTLLVHGALGGRDREAAEASAVALELLHTATLIHDDLVDGDDVRRGAPAAHARLRDALPPGRAGRGPALAALAGDAAVAWGLGLLRTPAALERTGEALRGVWLGAWLEAAGDPDTLRVARLKTSSLFELACDLGALAARAPEEPRRTARAYGLHLGLAYQMADDAADGAPDAAARRKLAEAEAWTAADLARRLPASPEREALAEAPGQIVRLALEPSGRRPP